MRNIFPQQTPSNEPTSTTEHQHPARPSTLPRGLQLQALNGQTSRGDKKEFSKKDFPLTPDIGSTRPIDFVKCSKQTMGKSKSAEELT
ncbi:hypothetical protein DPMN_059872 [Dreissena polymorpha]|uniref:Uncharacterized protein n=1 Tax=Dreissena polymorpha TaxID=45954 RepID=A0A9D4HGZ6_DREPO|nr:hypothetical protein DPMN_059872 [Dreissena polymorpha]